MAADSKERKPRRTNELGPIGLVVADNVRQLREQKRPRMSTYALSERLTELGRPILPTAVTKLEAGQRHVDVDDLVALAIALDVSPVRLLLPGEPPEDTKVDLTANTRSWWYAAWAWAIGDQPLAEEELNVTGQLVVEYIAENQPFRRRQELVRDTARFLLARALGGPFSAEFRYDGRKLTKATLTYDGGDDDGR